HPRSLSSESISLRPLLAPRSIAIIGASDRSGSIGEIILNSLKKIDFQGRVWPVNPKYESLAGHACFRSLDDLEEPPDVAAICLKGSNAIKEIRNLVRVGGKAAVIYDGGFAESGDDGKKQQDELVLLARRAGIAVCGPN